MDYIPVVQLLTDFPTSIDITIINDTMLNPLIHTFFVVLNTNDSQVELDPEEIQIDILDDEGLSAVLCISLLIAIMSSSHNMHLDRIIIMGMLAYIMYTFRYCGCQECTLYIQQ